MGEEFRVSLGVQLDSATLQSVKTQIKKELGNSSKNSFKLQMDTSRVQQQLNGIKSQIKSLGKIKIDLGGGVTSTSTKGNKTSKKEIDVYKQAQRELKKLYDLRIQYAKLKDKNPLNEHTFNKAIKQQEDVYKRAKSKTSTKDNYDINKRNELTRQEIVYQQQLAEAYNKTASAKTKSNNASKTQGKASATGVANTQFTDQKATLGLQMEAWLKRNTAAAGQFGDKITELQTRLKACDSKTNFNHIKSEFQQVKYQAEMAGKSGLTFAGRLSEQFKKLGTYLTATMVFSYITRGLRNMYENVKDIDYAMVELKKVTDETDNTYNKFLRSATKNAKKLGSTISDMVNASADFARLGFNISDSEELAKAATVYKNVGDGINDISTASEDIISTMKAFGIEAKDAMTIIDKFNEVGNNYAISSVGIGEALKDSASSLRMAGNDINEAIGLIVAGNTVVQVCLFAIVI